MVHSSVPARRDLHTELQSRCEDGAEASDIQCPLWGGPLEVRDAERFACERGHEISRDDVPVAASTRIGIALGMAVEVLDSEAAALPTSSAIARGDGASVGLAERAEQDASARRELASAHVPPGDGRASCG